MRQALKAALVDLGIVLGALIVAALVVAWALRDARADRGKPRIPTPEESMRWIQRCAIAMLTVDGLPVYRHAWCRYDPDTGLFEPLEKDLDRARIIDIRREREKP